jgi:hypothetical protein
MVTARLAVDRVAAMGYVSRDHYQITRIKEVMLVVTNTAGLPLDNGAYR